MLRNEDPDAVWKGHNTGSPVPYGLFVAPDPRAVPCMAPKVDSMYRRTADTSQPFIILPLELSLAFTTDV
jgi:hypothetical protein